MNSFIPFAKVDCSGNELRYIREVLESGWLTSASKVQLFEKLFAAQHEVPYACAVNSCTSALHLALEAIGVKSGDKVFVPSLTFTASAEVIRYLNADPIFLDVDYDTGLLTPAILRMAIQENPDIKYLIYVHFGGQIAFMEDGEYGEGIVSLCKKHGIRIVEDAAHAFPANQNGKMPGQFGDVACFSFYANKTMTTGEGGMVLTKNKDLYERMKVMRLHGINRDAWDRFITDKPSWEYDVIAPGFKYNMPDLNAAVGLAQLERAESMRQERQKCAEFYYENLDQSYYDLPMTHVDYDSHSWHLFPVKLKAGGEDARNKMIVVLADLKIGTSVHYKPLHRMTYYKELYGLDEKSFCETERYWKSCFSLPIYPGLSSEQLGYICKSLNQEAQILCGSK